jgi:hypothetical protein
VNPIAIIPLTAVVVVGFDLELNMTCTELASRIEAIEPHAPPREVARLCLLLANLVENTDELLDDGRLSDAWSQMSLRLQIATDQHAAMTEELENLAHSDPTKFSPEQIWILIRAIKVQSQALQLYLGESVLDV